MRKEIRCAAGQETQNSGSFHSLKKILNILALELGPFYLYVLLYKLVFSGNSSVL